MCKSILKKVGWCSIACFLSFFGGCLEDEKPIHKAAYKGDLNEIKEIIESDPNQINVQNIRGFTPLHFASGKGYTEIVEYLLEHKANTELADNVGDRPLSLAVRFGNYSVAKMLLEHGAVVNYKDDFGRTPLHKAAAFSGKEVINLLISYSADVNARDEHQSTPLHQAAMLNNIEAAEALVEHGADIFAKNFYDYRKPAEGPYIPPSRDTMNKTAREIALKAGHKELAQYLQTKEEETEKQKREEEKEKEKGEEKGDK